MSIPGSDDGHKIVISGMAGLYPKARYIKDLENILYNKVNPITADDLRWKYNHPEVSQFTGNVPDLNRFDAQFFKVHYRLALNMDSMSRKLLEQTYEAIYDAGMSPEHLSGKKVGVYIGSCFSETEKVASYTTAGKTGFGIAGCSKSMFANRISYWLNVKGPSLAIDQACCSSTAALEAAFKAILQEDCESAIVGGANLCLHPQSSVHYGRIINVSMDGNTKSFSEDAAGCARSEAINVLFLQRAKDAKRLYAELVHVKSEYVSIINGQYGPKYGFYRNPADTARFIKSVYGEAGVSPSAVEYVEAFGSAMPEADKSELEAIDDVFCYKREQPLLVGSVTSNIGYGEAASGLSAITKVLLGYHKGVLAGNLNCSKPRRDVAALQEGRMQLLSDHHQFQRRTYAAVNNMSVTGVNAHVILNGHYKPKDLDRYKSSIPRLVTISGRQGSAVERVFEILKSQPIDAEQIALLHSIHETNITGHLGKGYVILDSKPDGTTTSLVETVENCDEAQRPLWFVYSGMGSQWAGMGTQLMQIPVFADAIERCHKVLEPKGIDIVHIITAPEKTIFDNILHSFVGIAAIQIGLTDVLNELGIVPDKIIGHSVGELGCAYADGCLSAEEMILCAYSRGEVSLKTPLIHGSMAAIGVGAKQMALHCPPDIDIACHNSAHSCTVSGPANSMRVFVAQLSVLKIFAREVPCSNIAYHSRYIAGAGPSLLNYLKDIIKTPKLRSDRWVSTSVPKEKWDEPAAKYCSAEYQTNNLLNPVLFEETSSLIPANAVLVEIAPHGLLQAILKRALPDTATNIALTRRGADSSLVLLDAVGKLYLHGYSPKIRLLYPKVEFPVSTETPYLSHLVEWAHQEHWPLPIYQSDFKSMTASCTFLISIHGDNSYLHGHVIGDKFQLPISYILVAVWDTLAMSLNMPKKSFGVRFENIQIHTQPILHEQKAFRFTVSLHRGTGMFEVMEERSNIVTGYIVQFDNYNSTLKTNKKEQLELDTNDVYRILYNRGFSYSGDFRSIYNADLSVSNATLVWKDNWVTFIDGLLQLQTIKYAANNVVQPAQIQSMIIDLKKHSLSLEHENSINKILIQATLCNVQKKIWAGGLLIQNISFRNVHQLNKGTISLRSPMFIPRNYSGLDVFTSLYVFLQVIAENSGRNEISVVGLQTNKSEYKLFNEMENIVLEGIQNINIQYRQNSIDDLLCEQVQSYANVDVILTNNLPSHGRIIQRLRDFLPPHTFIINQQLNTTSLYGHHNIPSELYSTVSVFKTSNNQLELLCWKPIKPVPNMTTFHVKSDSDLVKLRNVRENISDESGIVITTPYPAIEGLLQTVLNWKRERNFKRVYVLVADKEFTYDFITNEIPNCILNFNIYKNGVRGGEYYLPVKTECRNKNEVALQTKVIGDFNSMRWVQASDQPKYGHLFVSVHYSGINMRDVRHALGLNTDINNENYTYGLDFSGMTERGERIMGVLPSGTATSHLIAHPELIWPVPEYWSLEEAATVPFAYLHAYYCLFMTPNTRSMISIKSILIHRGTGALGQAAISIALARGWRVFTTVRDIRKKIFLMKLFPELNENDIGNSRDITFKDMVLNATNAEGCNIVLCSLQGELKKASFKCCKIMGMVIDTTQILSNENYAFEMNNLTKDRSYLAADVSRVFNDMKSTEIKTLHNFISQGIVRGEVRPLTHVTFGRHETVRAFRLLAASQHCGRVLIRVSDKLSPVRSSVSSDEISCHAIICDQTSLREQILDKLIEHGISRLHLHVTTPISAFIKYRQRLWETQKLEVTMSYGSFNDSKGVTDVLKKIGKLGYIEGLHIVGNYDEHILNAIDTASRRFCPSIKSFIVLNDNSRYGYNMCMERFKSGLPATLLDVSLLKTFQDADGVTWYRGAAEAIEQALLCDKTILQATVKCPPRLHLIQKIAALTGLKINPEESSDKTLESLGLPDQNMSLVCVLLRNEYNTALEEKDVSSLTIDDLRHIEGNIHDKQFKKVRGLETFISFVDSDELLATTEMVFLPTLSSSIVMKDDEFDMSGTYLCVVPGLEGIHLRFRPLCERLKLPAFVLQPGFDRADESPQDLALRYSKIIVKRIALKKSFYIMGYETGVLVALELAAILEEHGMTGTVFALGEGPSEIQKILHNELIAYPSEETLQEVIIRHMFALMTHNADPTSLEEALISCGHSWSARVDTCVRLLLGHVPHSAQYARALLETAYDRIVSAYHAVPPKTVLRSKIVLLRSREQSSQADTNSLQMCSEQPVDIINLGTPLSHVARDMRVPDIVNSYLDNDTLQAFEGKNLCHVYVMKLDGHKAMH